MASSTPFTKRSAEFEVDMMRVVRSASFGAVLAPPLNALTLAFSNPSHWLWPTVDALCAETIFVPIMMFLYIDQEDVTIESVRPYIVQTLVITAAGYISISYVLTMAAGHSATWIPTLSNLGDLPPESIVFSLGTGATASLYALLVNIVSRQKAIDNETVCPMSGGYITTKQAVASGYASVIGMTCIAVFPQYAFAAYAHNTGMSVFFLGSIPFLMLMSPEPEERSVVRMPLFIIYTTSALCYAAFVSRLPIIGAASETVAGVAWLSLLSSGKNVVLRGPPVLVSSPSTADFEEN